MKCYERAYHYVVRKRGKSFLLMFILMIALIVGLVGMSLLRSFSESLTRIGTESQAKIIVFITDMDELLSNEQILQFEQMNNIYFVNRFNETVARTEDLEIISTGDGETIEDAKVRLQGFDDLKLDSLFALDVVQLETGTLDIKPNELIVYEPLAMLNELTIGDDLTFQTEQGEVVTAVIKGLYTYVDPDMENEKNAPSIYRYENLIFTHPELINHLQGKSEYMEAHSYVIDPTVIEETHHELVNRIERTTFETRISDMLYRKMSQPLHQISDLVLMIIVFTGGATILVVTLLLIIWSKERKHEVALLLSVGESKLSIVLQRILEGVWMYIGACILALFFSHRFIPYLATLLYQKQIGIFESQSIVVSLALKDIYGVVLVGLVIVTVSIISSCLSMIRLTPRAIFYTMD